ncbi:MAG: amino acid adenylation domain-containing protein, partial [Methylobacter sp.]
MQKTTELSNRRANLSVAKQAMLDKYLAGQVKTEHSKDAILPRFESEAELSCPQQRLFFLDHLQSINAAYNIPAVLQLKGTLNQEALQQTFAEIIRRHTILRTRFVQDGQAIRQIVAPKLDFSYSLIDLDALPDDRQLTEKQRLQDEDLQKTFALEQGPLLRINLLRLGDSADQQHYFLIFTLHHIISDGWSHSILIREFINIYSAFIQGKPSPLAELPIQYSDFAYWQRQWLKTEACKTQLDYWKQQLKDAPDHLQLPVTGRTAPEQNYKGGVYSFELPEILTARLNTLSRQQGASLFMTLLAAFNVLLHRYSSQNDICIGTPVANRNRQELECLIGCFVNTLVLRSDLSGNPAFTALLSATKKTVLDAQANQNLPFDKLVEELGTVRDLNRTPLFQVMFVMQNTPSGQLALPGLEVKLESADTQTAKFDLTLLFTEQDGSLHGQFEYNSNLFDEAAVQRMAGHYRVLMEGIVEQPELGINDLPLMQDQERKRIINDWGVKKTAYSPTQCLHRLFELQAETAPEATALTFESRSMTYRELNEWANRLAHYLIGLNVQPDDLIGLYVERSLEMVIGLLGILKAGCAYVPLDPSYPQQRIQYLLDDSGLSILITQSPLLGQIPAKIDHVVCLDKEIPVYSDSAKANPVNAARPANRAYIIYTSGSTGQPKGVEITHENVLRLFEASEMHFEFSSKDTWTLFHSYAFDFSVWEIWGALLYGGRLVVVPYQVSRTPEKFHQLLRDEQVTVLNQTPSAFRQLSAVDVSLPATGEGLALRYVIFGGEALSPIDLLPWFERHGDAKPQLINMYGITETTVHVTFQRIGKEHIDGAVKSPIGQALPDLYVYVLDQSLNPVPVGIPGELYVGGAGLARGYLNRPELTAERFIPDPYGTSRGGRLYKTGDLACYRENGCIDYLDRIDHQVKIRGFRIELGEIEAAIKKQSSVRDTVALVKEDQARGKYIVAYIVPQSGQSPTVTDLRIALKNTLPDYMVPALFVFLDAFPLTEHGKLNVKALPEPEGARPDLVKAYTAPRNETEEILAAIWMQVLDLGQVGIDDNFFDLGGDSIRSLQVLNLAKQRNLAFSLEQLYQSGTIRELAAASQPVSANHNVPTQAFSLISVSDRDKLPNHVEDAYPMTSLQAGMVFHSQYESNAYHVVDSILLECKLEIEVLIKIIQQVIERHPVLRSAFDLGNYSEPLQLVFAKDKVESPIEFDDWRLHSGERQQQQLALWLESERSRTFDINKPPLIRFHIHQLSDDTFQFSVTEHHAVLDGWSLNAMLNEIFSCYLSFLNRQNYTIDSSPYNALRDLVVWERDAIKSEPHQLFWQNKLNSINHSLLPAWAGDGKKTDRSKPARKLVTLSPDISDALQDLAKSLSVPLKSVLLAAHLKLLGMIYGEQNITTGLVCSVRPETDDADSALGVFLNTLPLPFQLQGGTWSDLIVQVFNAECELLKFRFYPLAQIQQDAKQGALFDAVFHYVHFYNVSDLAESEQFKALDWVDYIEPNFELEVAFQLDIRSAQIRLLVSGNGRRLDEQQIVAASDYLIELLSEIAQSPNERYERRNFLTEAEQQQILIDWNSTETDYPKDRYIHQLFETQAEQTPDALALAFEGQTLTYAELNAKANQLAHYLIGQGVGPDMLVGVCLERSLE